MLLDYFSQAKVEGRPLADYLQGDAKPANLSTLKEILDYIHMSQGLLKPYGPDYPIIEPYELLPSFEDNLTEYKDLPSFSMLVLDRPLDYLAERLQFDLLETGDNGGRNKVISNAEKDDLNREMFKSRLPKEFHLDFKQRLADKDITELRNYPEVLNFIFQMDRAHIIARDADKNFRSLGLFASLPSNLDKEIKRFGKKIGKFNDNDVEMYRANRQMVYQFLMELYGFPIASERRTSAALFTRALARGKERFIIKVQGQSDRVITTLYYPNTKDLYPFVEKAALVPITAVSRDTIRELEAAGYFVDPERRIVLLRTIYQQHRYNKNNIVEERALSLRQQEIIHPRTGETYPFLNVLQARDNRLLQFNDIVRGEFSGRMIFQRQEVVENTTNHEDRLKFIYAWLSKHQRRFVISSPSFIEKLQNILESYMLNPEMKGPFKSHRDLVKLINQKWDYIVQVNSLGQIEQMRGGRTKAKCLDMLDTLIDYLSDCKKEIAKYSEPVFNKLLSICQDVLDDKYIVKRYINEAPQTGYGLTVAKKYRKLYSLTVQMKKDYAKAHKK